MHERSLARAIIGQVLEEALRRELGTICAVSVDIGEFAGVEPTLLKAAFEELAPERLGNVVELELTTMPLRARCKICGTEFTVLRFKFRCPECASATTIIAGENVVLTGITAKSKATAGDVS